jgi:hypothetical protein
MPPKDQKIIDFGIRFARGLIDGSIVSLGLSVAFRTLIEQKDAEKLAKKLNNKSFTNEEKEEMKKSGLTVQEIKDEIDNQKTLLEDRENPDKKATQEEKKAREEAEKKTKEAEEKTRDAIISGKASEIALSASSEAQRELIIEEAEKTRRRALEEGKKQGETELGRRMEGKLDTVVSRQAEQATRRDIGDLKQSINSALLTFDGGRFASRRINQIDFKGADRKDVGGLGLNTEQRADIKAIVTSQAGAGYAEAVDLISGDRISPNNLFDGLVAIAISGAIPIPIPIITRMSRQFRRFAGVDIDKYFKVATVGDNQVLLMDKSDVENNKKEFDSQIAKKSKSKSKQKEKKTEEISGAMIGGGISAVVGNQIGGPIAGVMAGTAGAALGAGVELASRTELPRIAGQITQRIADATPRLPSVEGIRRGVRRAITTDSKQISFPTITRRSATQNDFNEFYREIINLDDEYLELEQTINEISDMIIRRDRVGESNINLLNRRKEIEQELQNNRNRYEAIQSVIRRPSRLGVGRRDITVPTIRRTTDEEKALVPFDEEKERMSKEDSLALVTSFGAANVITNRDKIIPNFFREEPVKLPVGPGDVFTQQTEDELKKITGKGLLRPKFIIPNVNILQPSDQELAADALEFAAFDFVRPNTEGGEGDLNTNILKRSQKLNENIRFQGAGVQVNSLFGYDLPVQPSQETINNLFLYKALPPLKFQEQEYNLSEFEVMSYDPINQRGAIEMFSPYNDFSDTIPDDRNEMDTSMLFSIVP